MKLSNTRQTDRNRNGQSATGYSFQKVMFTGLLINVYAPDKYVKQKQKQKTTTTKSGP